MAGEEGQQHPLKIYYIMWGALFVLSFFSYMVDYLNFQGGLRWTLILVFMFLKASGIVLVFMHMGWERLALKLAILGPPVAILVLLSYFARDKQVFGMPWGKTMMWIFLLSDTFIFSCFLVSYMSVRIATTDPWPVPSEVFALSFGGDPIPLILIAIKPNNTSQASNPSNAFFFLLTGIHALHILGGMYVWARATQKVFGGSNDVAQSISLCTIYWHFLLLVWLVLFGLMLST